MSDSYYFDKRKLKRVFGKYGIIFLISFVPIILLNIYVFKDITDRWLVILLDCIILLVFVVIGNVIANRIFDNRDRKLERLRKEREELDRKKQEILENSYKKKREEKQIKKQQNVSNDTKKSN